jgi:hypothetical protein
MKPVLEFAVKYFTKKEKKKNVLAQGPDEDFIPYAIHFDKKNILTAQAILSARRNKESLKQNHATFLNDNPRLKTKIESTRSELGMGSR